MGDPSSPACPCLPPDRGVPRRPVPGHRRLCARLRPPCLVGREQPAGRARAWLTAPLAMAGTQWPGVRPPPLTSLGPHLSCLHHGPLPTGAEGQPAPRPPGPPQLHFLPGAPCRAHPCCGPARGDTCGRLGPQREYQQGAGVWAGRSMWPAQQVSETREAEAKDPSVFKIVQKPRK